MISSLRLKHICLILSVEVQIEDHMSNGDFLNTSLRVLIYLFDHMLPDPTLVSPWGVKQ
jgi:hypothetical protein